MSTPESKELKEFITGGSEAQEYSMKGITLTGYCERIYDGDTCTIVAKHAGKFSKFTLRMNGYDSPEKRTKKSDNETPEEIKTRKKWANHSKDHLAYFISNRYDLKVHCIDEDKYGRILANVSVINNGVEFDVNKEMVTNGYCVPYGINGNLHKEKWDYSKLVYKPPRFPQELV